jgi:hypothetical protein
MSDNPFGFRKRRSLSDKTGSIAPAADARQSVPVDRIDDAAAKYGFVSRDPDSSFERKKITGPTVTLHTRAPVKVATPFQRFCEKNQYSYWEGVEELMERAGVI